MKLRSERLFACDFNRPLSPEEEQIRRRLELLTDDQCMEIFGGRERMPYRPYEVEA